MHRPIGGSILLHRLIPSIDFSAHGINHVHGELGVGEHRAEHRGRPERLHRVQQHERLNVEATDVRTRLL